ncbi:MAG: tRNA (N(6)-L-threonylcarbamoyladenosine(37)-C(2))-methylthiotransferase MtaB [Thalassobaculaceae bacterium]|nr:tRNA (N(6)-L-threonylcarbamoyladenosine(37)-C(2))-methylthiotransferase MtaB [Thalassobaculaceae bacterium]
MAHTADTATAPSHRVETFGCRLNAHESDLIQGHLAASGAGDTIVVNTCAVTSEAERQSRQAIRRLIRENPDAQVVVTGCAAQIDPDRYAAIPGVARVVGNEEKLRPETWNAPADDTPRILVNDIMSVRETAAHLVTEAQCRERAIVQVQQGCDHRCTFCVIPFGRGNSRSVPMGVIVDQARALVASGYREMVLSGVDITSYGGDLPGRPSLGQMVRRLLALVPELPRLRLSSVDPVELDDDIWRLLESEPRFMPHLHLSLQAGDDMVLKRMKRRHLRDDAIRVVERARALRPDVAFGADVIAGFPTETEAMHANTAALIRDLGLQYLHIFPYSPRPGTPAARMPQVHGDARKARAAELRAIGAETLARWLDTRIGTYDRVLVERDAMGHGESFAEIRVSGGAAAGEIVEVTLTGRDGTVLIGERAARVAA